MAQEVPVGDWTLGESEGKEGRSYGFVVEYQMGLCVSFE